MANSNHSVIAGKLRGTLGKEIVFRDWEGKTVVAKAPGSRKGKPSASQEQKQEKFLLASKYARGVVKGQDQSMRDAYAAALRPRQNIYSRALEDFMSEPKVKSIDASNYDGTAGTRIAVRAVDDFRVVSVELQIYAGNGTLIENGNAEPNPNGIDWTYIATQANNPRAGSKIKAIAKDVPSNEGTMEVIL